MLFKKYRSIGNKYCLEVWIGLAKVEASKKVLGNAEKAYVNVLALAKSESNYRKNAKEYLLKIGCKVLRIEDPEPLNKRIEKYEVDKSLLQLAKSLLNEGERARVGIFHAYD